MSATLADVVAAGVVPTVEEIAQARGMVGGMRTMSDLFCYEAGTAGAAGRGLVSAVLAGDADRVARWLRAMVAASTAADARADPLVAAGTGRQ